MENFEKLGNEIVGYINDPVRRTVDLLRQNGARFVLCGISGSGKTRAVEFANNKLPEDQKIAESQELLFTKNLSEALDTFRDESPAYESSRHIGFNVVRKEIAKEIEENGEKVFWFSGRP